MGIVSKVNREAPYTEDQATFQYDSGTEIRHGMLEIRSENSCPQ